LTEIPKPKELYRVEMENKKGTGSIETLKSGERIKVEEEKFI
jgi:hypothetical protein